jgi:hypothetical protein
MRETVVLSPTMALEPANLHGRLQRHASGLWTPRVIEASEIAGNDCGGEIHTRIDDSGVDRGQQRSLSR